MEAAPDTIVVFTAKTVENLLAQGGSGSWILDRNNARRCRYIVCTRNAHPKEGHEDLGPEPHGSAFLIARIADVVEDGPDRWRVTFAEYARLDKPAVWQGLRNPVRYARLADLARNEDLARFVL